MTAFRVGLLLLLFYDGTATGVGVFVVGLDFHALAWCRCVDVLAVAKVDANVVCACAPEYEVARLKVGEGNRGAGCLLGVGDTRDAQATFFVNVLYKAAAVKACRGGATPYVWDADVFLGSFYDAFPGGFFYEVRVYGVDFEGLPEWRFLFLNQHEGGSAHGYNTVGECLEECHWCIGDAVFYFDAISGTVLGQGNGGFVCVIV